jgi:hypothetical protein
MEVIMNIEVEELIEKAKKIISRTGNKPGTKYPNSLKKIVISLRVDHAMSVKDVIKFVPVSSYSAREWPKQSIQKESFNKVIVQADTPLKKSKKKIIPRKKQFEIIIFNQKILIVLTALWIFESLAFHLFD